MSFSTEDRDFVPPEIKGRKWLLVAEAPGYYETIFRPKRPLVGPTGTMTDAMLWRMNMPRNMWDVTNACLWRPPYNNLMPWFRKQDERLVASLEMLKELVQGNSYDYILALGWYALWALTGKRGIAEHRGSVYQSTLADVPVIGTYHPAVLFEEPKLANLIWRDLGRFRNMTQGNPPVPLQRNLILFPTPGDIAAFRERALNAPWMAVDIETPGKRLGKIGKQKIDPLSRRVTEIGFALSPADAICVPRTEESEPVIRELLAAGMPKVFHNAHFDPVFMQYVEDWEVNGEFHDTMLAHHTLYPESPRDLGYCVSLYTTEPYFKNLGKSRGNDQGTLAEFYRYNALDVATTAEIFQTLLGKAGKLEKFGLSTVYERDRRAIKIANDMSSRGIRLDRAEVDRFREKLLRDWRRWQSILDVRCGVDPAHVEWYNTPEGWAKLIEAYRKGRWAKVHEGINVSSPKLVQHLLYTELKLPPLSETDKKTKRKKLTSKQTKLLYKYPQLPKYKQKVLKPLLMVRKARKLLGTYVDIVTPDDRVRGSFGVAAAETGRWNCSTLLIDREGMNLQTLPPEFKRCLIADDGYYLAVLDYKQIEAVLTAYDAEDLEQIALFERMATGDPTADIHKLNASRVLGCKPEQVTPHQRQYIGKSTHAVNYDVKKQTLCEFVNRRGLESGIFITPSFADMIIKEYRKKSPAIVQWHKRVWQDGKKTKVQFNHMGRRRIFLGPTAGPRAHDTRGEMIANRPQSTVPDMLTEAMLKLEADGTLKCPECDFQLLAQAHDAVIVQGKKGTLGVWLSLAINLMVIPLTIHGRRCIVPVEAKYGERLSKMKEWSNADND